MQPEQLPRSNPIVLELGEDFYDAVQPAVFPEEILRYRNNQAAEKIGLNQLNNTQWLEYFGKFKSIPQNLESPLALRYHGHQFQNYNPQLGDGRGFLYAQFLALNGKTYDLGTKGSGTTPYSRNGDGRLTLKGAVREALATETLESLGVNTSKTFSIIETGEALHRNDEPSPTRSAVLTRMSLGHIRIGTFQRLLYFKQEENIRKLAEYCVRHFYSDIQLQDPQWPLQFLTQVIERNAQLVAEVMCAGFVHGVLNTDNINVSGELFDYGPYRFAPTYDPQFVAAYFDQSGLYAYGQQPAIFLWNLQRFAETLQFAFKDLDIEKPLESFGSYFFEAVHQKFLTRLNLKSRSKEEDQNLLGAFFEFLHQSQSLFEQTFFDFYGGLDNGRWSNSPQKKLYDGAAFAELKNALSGYSVLSEEFMKHTYFRRETPETLLIDEIESIWSEIAANDNWQPFNIKIQNLRSHRGAYKTKPPL